MTELRAAAAEVLEATAALVVLLSQDGRILDANRSVLEATGRSPEDLVGKEAVTVLCPPRDAADLLRLVRTVGRTGESQQHEHDLPRHGDRRTSIAWTTSRLSDPAAGLVCVGVDVSRARLESDDLLARSLTDELTGLPNRVHLLQSLGRMSGSGASVLFCDLNGFKGVNDSFGHAAGDAVLVEVGRRLKLAVRGEDLVARLGGDEFVIVAPPSPTASPAGLSRRVLNAMRQPMLLAGGVVVVIGVSIGTAELLPGASPADVLRQADAQMYSAKSLRASEGGLRGAPPVPVAPSAEA